MSNTKDKSPGPIFIYNVFQTRTILGISKIDILRLIRSQQLKTIKIDDRTFIKSTDLLEYRIEIGQVDREGRW